MIKYSFRLLLVTLFFVALPCIADDEGPELSPGETAWINAGHTVRVRIDHAPPFMFTDGKVRGIAIDYLTHIFNLHGIDFSYVPETEVTWPDALKYIGRHEVVDMVPTAKITEERKARMNFTREYIVAPWVIFTRSDANFISSIDDLKGKLVAVEEGFVMHDRLARDYPEIRLKVASAKLENFFTIPLRDLSTGQVDAYVGNLLSTTYMIQSMGYTNVKVAAPTPFDNHNQAMAVRNDWPDLVSIIDKTLASMTPEEHAAIRNRWLSVRYEYGISYTDVFKWLGGILAAAAVFIGVVVVSNRKLKGEVVSRQRAEENLAASENRLRATLDATPFPVAIVDPGDEEILFWSRRAETLFGHTAPTTALWYQTAYPDPIYRDEVVRQWKAGLESARSSGHPVNSGEYRISCRDGSTKICEIWANYIPDNLIVTFHDITEKARLREKIKAQEKEIRHAEKMESVGTLAGGIAHDFNNILSIILGFNEIISDQLEKESPLRESTQEIRTAGLRARDVVRQLLTFSSIDDATKEQLDLANAVSEAFRFIRATMPANIGMELNIPEKLPLISGNTTQINQLMINLCSNARDALAESGGKISIELVGELLPPQSRDTYPSLSPGRYIRLSVKDNGCGMDEATLERIFDPYFTTKEIGKGSGIGLSVVHGIVRWHGGEVFTASEPDRGTTVSILFPIYDLQVANNHEKIENLPRGSEKVLIVDDEAPILKLGIRRLSNLGYRVFGTTDAVEAMELFKNNPEDFDLVVTDMAMPKMTGKELARQILQLRPDIPIILCTGYSEKISSEDAASFGIRTFVMKPVEYEEFAAMVRQALDQSA